jgi:16S rRNA processing protein RimM
MLVVRIEGVDDRTAAEALNGVELFVDRAELAEPEEDEFYQADLVGLEARDPGGRVIGIVAAVHDFGAGDILEITPEKGAAFMVAFTRDNVPEIDVAGGYLVVHRPAETEARGEEK